MESKARALPRSPEAYPVQFVVNWDVCCFEPLSSRIITEAFEKMKGRGCHRSTPHLLTFVL